MVAKKTRASRSCPSPRPSYQPQKPEKNKYNPAPRNLHNVGRVNPSPQHPGIAGFDVDGVSSGGGVSDRTTTSASEPKLDPSSVKDRVRPLPKLSRRRLSSASSVEVRACDSTASRALRRSGEPGPPAVSRRIRSSPGQGRRHTHATELREEGVDIGIINKQPGRPSIATRARYLDHIAPLAVVEAIRARSRDTSANGI
jgi:hypothetical protein